MWIEIILIAVIGAFFTVVYRVRHLGEAPFFTPTPSQPEQPKFYDRLLYYALRRKQVQLDEQGTEIELQGRALELKTVEVELLHKERSFEHREDKLALSQISIDLHGRALEIEHQKQQVIKEQLAAQAMRQNVVNEKLEVRSHRQDVIDEKLRVRALEQKIEGDRLVVRSEKQDVIQERLNLGKDKLAIDAGKVELGRRSNSVERQRLGVTKERLRLEADGLTLKEQFLQLMAEGQKLTAREANLGYQVREFNLHMRERFLHLASDRLTLQEQEAAFRLNVKHHNNVLAIRKLKLDLLERSIKDNYQIRMEWLKIQSRQNRLDFQDQRRDLRVLYDETTRRLGEIRLSKWANTLYVKEEDIRMQKRQLEFLRQQWLW